MSGVFIGKGPPPHWRVCLLQKAHHLNGGCVYCQRPTTSMVVCLLAKAHTSMVGVFIGKGPPATTQNNNFNLKLL